MNMSQQFTMRLGTYHHTKSGQKNPVGGKGFYPRSLSYLVSGSWSPKKFQICISSYGVGLKPNQVLIGYFQKLCSTIALAGLAGRTPLYLRVFVVVLVFMCLLWQCAEYFPVPKTYMVVRDVYIIFISACSSLHICCCVGVIFSNGSLLSIYGEQPTVLTIALIV